MITVFQVANYFIKKFKDNSKPLTHRQLQKLVYYAYAYYLKKFNESLFPNKFRAWAFEPVNQELYFATNNHFI